MLRFQCIMLKSKQQAASSSEAVAAQQIQVLVGYDWSLDATSKRRDGLNKHWAFLRDEVKVATQALERIASKREKSTYPLKIAVKRLRARHGVTIVAAIMRRISEADILIFDVSGDNRNVHFELGCALAVKGLDSERVYIFSDTTDVASDLSGLMLTKYKKTEDGAQSEKAFAKLEDHRGFRAALVATLRQVAEEREMLGNVKRTFEAEEENGEDTQQACESVN
jgi:hypothetical protein